MPPAPTGTAVHSRQASAVLGSSLGSEASASHTSAAARGAGGGGSVHFGDTLPCTPMTLSVGSSQSSVNMASLMRNCSSGSSIRCATLRHMDDLLLSTALTHSTPHDTGPRLDLGKLRRSSNSSPRPKATPLPSSAVMSQALRGVRRRCPRTSASMQRRACS